MSSMVGSLNSTLRLLIALAFTGVLGAGTIFLFPFQAAMADDISGDYARGGMLFTTRCSACHAFNTNKTGPMLQGVVGRKAGTATGYDSSDALKTSGIIWDEGKLNQWLADPETMTPGTYMSFKVANTKDRADIIAYLKLLSAPAPAGSVGSIRK